MKKRMSVSEAARIMGRAGRGDCKRRNVDYRKLARMAVAARRKKALMKGKDENDAIRAIVDGDVPAPVRGVATIARAGRVSRLQTTHHQITR